MFNSLLDFQENGGFTPLHIAVIYGLFDAIESILRSPGVKVETSNLEGLNPLHFMITQRVTL